jgi:subtilisin
VSDLLPAWSEPFHTDVTAHRLGLDHPVTRAWAYGDASGRGVRVAVIDSGVESGHPLVGDVVGGAVLTLDSSADDGVRVVEGPHGDLYGHGTACAGIIRALAPEVELLSVQVLGSNLKGSARTFARGLEWCIDHGVDIVNLSLSTANENYFETFHDLVDRASFAGVLVVSAMNNEPKTTIPSEFAGVFSVACAPDTDRERILHNPAAPAEWGAAGIDVEVAWSGGGTMTATGNSFAAPVIAGHLARLRGAHPTITPWQARTVLAELADNHPPSG